MFNVLINTTKRQQLALSIFCFKKSYNCFCFIKECHNDVLFNRTSEQIERHCRLRYSDCVILTRQTCFRIKTNKCKRNVKQKAEKHICDADVEERIILLYMRAIKKRKKGFFITQFLCSTEKRKKKVFFLFHSYSSMFSVLSTWKRKTTLQTFYVSFVNF
jgi:hypothetical protein